MPKNSIAPEDRPAAKDAVKRMSLHIAVEFSFVSGLANRSDDTFDRAAWRRFRRWGDTRFKITQIDRLANEAGMKRSEYRPLFRATREERRAFLFNELGRKPSPPMGTSAINDGHLPDFPGRAVKTEFSFPD